jgi:hypothetical protein
VTIHSKKEEGKRTTPTECGQKKKENYHKEIRGKGFSTLPGNTPSKKSEKKSEQKREMFA